MPKLKTHKGLAKRFKITKSGKIKRQRACRGHLLGKKPRSRKRYLRRPDTVATTDKKSIRILLPYG